MRPALEMREVTRHYQAGVGGCFASVRALDGVSLALREGDVTGVVGPAGCGKSTLLLCAAGLLRVDGGAVSWFGRPADGSLPRRPPDDVAYVPARAGYYPFLTVREALEHYAAVHESAAARGRPRSEDVLERVGLADRAGERVSRLASSALRRLALAQALLARPRLLVLDDPLADAVGEARRRVVGLLAELAADGVGVLLAAPDAASLAGVAGRALRLERGRVSEEVALPPRAAGAGADALRRALELRVGAPATDGAALARALAGVAGVADVADVADVDGIAQEATRHGSETLRSAVPVEHFGEVLRVPLGAVSPEEVLAQCRAIGVTVHESRIVVQPCGLGASAERRVAEPAS